MEKNKKLDRFIRKSVKEVGLEKPSVDFTDLIFSKIQKSAFENQIIAHKPLMSKSMWVVILSIVASVFAYVLFANPAIENTWFSISQLNRLTTFNLSGRMPNLAVPNTFIYSLSIFVFFAMIQIFMIVRRINKNYSLN